MLITIPEYVTLAVGDDGVRIVSIREDSNLTKDNRQALNDWVSENVENVSKIIFNDIPPDGAETIADLIVGADGQRALVASSGLRLTTVGKGLEVTGLLVEQHGRRVLLDGDLDQISGELDSWLMTKAVHKKRPVSKSCGVCSVHYGKGAGGGLTIQPQNDGEYYEIVAGGKTVIWAPGEKVDLAKSVDLSFVNWESDASSTYQIGLGRIERISLLKLHGNLVVPGSVFVPMTEGMVEFRKHQSRPIDPNLDPGSAPQDDPFYDKDEPFVEYRSATKEQIAAAIDCGTCRFYRPAIESEGVTGGCSQVRGVISADDVCNLFKTSESGFPEDDFSYVVAKAVGEKQYTFGVVYKSTNPGEELELDAHDEFVKADILQEGQWDYVKTEDRGIHLQHDMMGYIKVGEWVDIVAWPYEQTIEFEQPDGTMNKSTIPANSVYMGVLWNDQGWKMVKNGSVRGLSMGGMAQRKTIIVKQGEKKK